MASDGRSGRERDDAAGEVFVLKRMFEEPILLLTTDTNERQSKIESTTCRP